MYAAAGRAAGEPGAMKRFPQFPNKSYLINAVHPNETGELGWAEGEKNNKK
jgi:hypothetical protein